MKIKPEYTALVAFVAGTFSGAATVLLALSLFR